MIKGRTESIVTGNSMKYKKPLVYLQLALASLMLSVFFAVFPAPNAYAVNIIDCPDGTSMPFPTGGDYYKVCANHMDSLQTDPLADPAANCSRSGGCDLVKKYLNPAIGLFSAVVGIVVVFSIISGGILYSASAGDPQKAAKAKSHIYKAVIALVAYSFLFAFLQWIIPGGLLNK